MSVGRKSLSQTLSECRADFQGSEWVSASHFSPFLSTEGQEKDCSSQDLIEVQAYGMTEIRDWEKSL